jgi:hypothetical protein
MRSTLEKNFAGCKRVQDSVNISRMLNSQVMIAANQYRPEGGPQEANNEYFGTFGIKKEKNVWSTSYSED